MSTRLYPTTENPQILEALANVPAGTSARLDGLKKQFDDKRDRLLGETRKNGISDAEKNRLNGLYEATTSEEIEKISQDPDCYTLEHFLNFGWGRLQAETATVIQANHMDINIGTTESLKMVQAMIATNGILLPEEVKVADLVGLTWG